MGVLDELRRAMRRLREGTAGVLLTIAMLALAIGVTTAMFTCVDALMLHPVPFREADRLTALMIARDGRFGPYVAPAAIEAMRKSGAFEGVEAASQAPVVLEGPDGPTTVGAARVSPGLFDLLGVQPILGRAFTSDEGRGGTDDRIVISEALWTSKFGRDPSIVGRRIPVSGVSTEVVGVMPAAFRFPFANVKAWQPTDYAAPPATPAQRRATSTAMAFARERRGVPAEDARRLAENAVRSETDLAAEQHLQLRPLAKGMVDDYARRAAMALSVGVALVFLVLCVNAMNLMLTRLSARQHEFGVCAALGASRARLMREGLIEALIMGAAAAAVGLLLAADLVDVAAAYLPDAMLAQTLAPVTVSGRAVAATSALAALAVAIVALAPVWMATAVDAADALRGMSRGATQAHSHSRLARVLLIGQVALAAALLAGASQLVRTFVKLTHADKGLNSEGVITAWVALPPFAFPDRAGRIAFASSLDERLRQLPGVRQVSLSSGMPPGAGSLYFSTVRSDTPGAPGVDGGVQAYHVGPAFFDLFGIPTVAGRTFSPPSSPDETVLGERLARLLWPSGDAVGRTFTIEGHQTPYRVIGVVREIRSPSLNPLLDEPEMYHPLVVADGGGASASAFGAGQIFLALRCTAGCGGVDAVRKAIREISARAEIVRLGPMDEEYLKAVARPRAAAALGTIFATVALVTATGGLFGVLMAAVARRRREFGIRVALGLAPAALKALVFRDALRLAAAGLVLGVAGGWVLSRALASLTYGVSPADPVSWAIVCASIAAAVLLAAWRPSVRAARVSPSELLRAE